MTVKTIFLIIILVAITIKDVAKLAGVSHTTVSMVIHDDSRITPATKEKVLKAIKELNYHPNYLARGLVKGKTNTIAVVASFFSSPFELDILKGIELQMDKRKSEYNFNQYATRGNDKIKAGLFSSILYGKRADAVIALNLKPQKEILADYKKDNIPIVLIEEMMEGVSYIKSNNVRGAYIATEYLIKKGKKNIGLINGATEGDETGLSPIERLEGYRQALMDYKLPFKKENMVGIFYYYFEEGKDALNTFYKRKSNIDSIFCAAGDLVAMGVLVEARDRGISIPGDIAVVGYDDIFLSSIVTPTLTTIKLPVMEMGKKAINFAMDMIEKKMRWGQKYILQPELIIRESA
ncbi:MAG: LacI family DNA-binding transcriptional regulator [Spirochaetales bacterium]|nr:LacI family DNA-binding transcriptional regulator [Spirochaetales bacterium]